MRSDCTDYLKLAMLPPTLLEFRFKGRAWLYHDVKLSGWRSSILMLSYMLALVGSREMVALCLSRFILSLTVAIRFTALERCVVYVGRCSVVYASRCPAEPRAISSCSCVVSLAQLAQCSLLCSLLMDAADARDAAVAREPSVVNRVCELRYTQADVDGRSNSISWKAVCYNDGTVLLQLREVLLQCLDRAECRTPLYVGKFIKAEGFYRDLFAYLQLDGDVFFPSRTMVR